MQLILLPGLYVSRRRLLSLPAPPFQCGERWFEAGQYQFYVGTTLPGNLPPSFNSLGDPSVHVKNMHGAEVRYKLVVTAHRPGLKSKVRDSAPICVLRLAPSGGKAEGAEQPAEQPAEATAGIVAAGWCCRAPGDVLLRLRVCQEVARAGETMQVRCRRRQQRSRQRLMQCS